VPAPGFNINEVLASIDRNGGLVRTNLFRVLLSLPRAIRQPSVPLQNDTVVKRAPNGEVSLYCEAASIPAVSLDTQPVHRFGYGPVERKPFGVQFNDINLIFRADRSGIVHSYLHAWMCAALHYDYPGTMSDKQGVITNQHAFELNYKEDYAVDTPLELLDETEQGLLRIVLREAYPVFIGDAPVAWSSRSEYLRLPVTLTFVSWYTDYPLPPKQSEPQPAGP
jgi:hypothetical protein